MHADYIQKNMHSSTFADAAEDSGVDSDQVKELVEDLLTIRDAYAAGDDDEETDELGEDEE
jgi:hypothetical protein